MPFHGSNRGSNPLGDANSRFSRSVWFRVGRLLNRSFRLVVTLSSGLPKELRVPAGFLLLRWVDPAARRVRLAVESRRAEIASREGSVAVWYSPEPGSAELVEDVDRPPGKVFDVTFAHIAQTGKNAMWGTFLYLLARRIKARKVLELGSCAGLSAMYMASAETVESLVTVEGSGSLAGVARETLAPFKNVRVNNQTFDECFAQLKAEGAQGFDIVFIDGHHESTATLRYLEQSLPLVSDGGLLIFDDVSWSDDMRSAWDRIRHQDIFDHAVDFGVLGICRLRKQVNGRLPRSPTQWDLRFLTGVTTIGQPWGWKVET